MKLTVGELADGWWTDLGVLQAGGAQVEDRGPYVVVRSPHNPTYHWGNFVLVTDAALVDDADRWVTTFGRELPDAGHVAIGLPVAPSPDAWAGHAVELEENTVLATSRVPARRSLTSGYVMRALDGDADWAALVRRDEEENLADGRFEPAAHRVFVQRQVATRRRVAQTGRSRWFGAFADGELASSLGIVLCGNGIARYQAVRTHPDHRRRGLAGHLLGVAADWAAAQGATRWVILTEVDNPAGRLYRSVGFAAVQPQHQAYSPGPTALR